MCVNAAGAATIPRYTHEERPLLFNGRSRHNTDSSLASMHSRQGTQAVPPTCNVHHVTGLELDIRGEGNGRCVIAAEASELQLAAIQSTVLGGLAGSIGAVGDVQGAVEVISSIVTRQQPLAEQDDVGHTCGGEGYGEGRRWK